MNELHEINELRACELFKSLGEDDLFQLYDATSKIRIKTGDYLIRQGADSDCLYVLVSGRLMVMADNADEKYYVSRGETVGEMGLISQTPRSSSVIALRDSVLLKLDRSNFNILWAKNPSVLFEISKTITKRLQLAISSKGTHRSNIVFLSADSDVNASDFLDRLGEFLDSHPNCRIVRRTDFRAQISSEQLSAQLRKLEFDFEHLLYQVDFNDAVWQNVCLDFADNIVVLTRGRGVPKFSEYIKQVLSNFNIHQEIKKTLVFVYEGNVNPSNTKSWIESFNFFKHHHVSVSHSEDIRRLLRILTGTAVGLVLGGGGTRVWAQIGVMKYIFEEKIPIDAYVGTSAGALNAAVLSIARDFQDYIEISERISSLTNFAEYTIPYTSLLSSRSITTALKDIFGERRIEELPKFLCCVTADLVLAQEVNITSGPVWQGVRASISIPGVYPPVSVLNQLLVDGGVVNNLPVDVMRDYFGYYGKVIAIDISAFNNDIPDYDYPLELTWLNILKLLLFQRSTKRRMPAIGETFLRGLLLASDQRVQENKKLCDIYIRPDLKKFGMLDLTKKLELEAIGYQEGQKELSQWRVKMNMEW